MEYIFYGDESGQNIKDYKTYGIGAFLIPKARIPTNTKTPIRINGNSASGCPGERKPKAIYVYSHHIRKYTYLFVDHNR